MSEIIQLNEAVSEYQIIIEGTGKEKQYYLDSKWMQSNVVNKNGRMYQEHEFQEQIQIYNENKISNRRGVGELDHPNCGGMNMHRFSHIFETPLYMDGGNVCGKARVLDTAYGQTLKVIIDEKMPFGVSSRGTGLLKKMSDYNLVENFFMITPGDVVWSQSAPDAIPTAIIEMIVENDKRMEEIVSFELIDEVKREIRNTEAKKLDYKKLELFYKIMQSL